VFRCLRLLKAKESTNDYHCRRGQKHKDQKCSHSELTRLIVEQQPSRKSDGDG
jgi:hypothetical protein